MRAVRYSLGHALGYFLCPRNLITIQTFFVKSILYRNLRIISHIILLSPLIILK